jgi:hypothetical protein
VAGRLAGALALALLWFVVQKVHYLTDYSPSYYTDYFWPRRAGLIPHLIGGSLAITAGLVQIWLGLTNRVGALHHALGRVYAAGVLIGSLGGFTCADDSRPTAIRCGTLCVMCGMGNHDRHGSVRHWYATHRTAPRMVIRSYTVTFAFVTYRLVSYWLRRWMHMPEPDVVDQIDTLMAWACWAVPLLFAEPLIQLRSMRKRVRVSGA